MAYDPNAELPGDQEGILSALVALLEILASNSPIGDTARRNRVSLDTLNGTALLSSAGASGAGSLRVSPANDTAAGVPVSVAGVNPMLPIIYNNIVVS